MMAPMPPAQRYRVLSITAGAGGMYCGSCLRDNALAAELVGRGHDVTLIPLYTPLLTDEENVTRPDVLFGGINVYLQQNSALFRKAPRFIDRLLDAPGVIKAFAGRSVSVDPKLLGGLTMSMLEGEQGVLKKEFDKLREWIAGEPAPDVINITNSMLLGLAPPLAKAFGRPICCMLQGEDFFLDGLTEPYRNRAIELIRGRAAGVDRFIAISEYYASYMSKYLHIPPQRMSMVPLGINLMGFEEPRASKKSDDFVIGFFARVAPEKGLHLLANAFIALRRRTGSARIRLETAGYLAPAHLPRPGRSRR
jgi:glycosyltransferase involved in cell wall biosynthesis